MTWNDLLPERRAIWTPIAVLLMGWMAWQLFVTVPQRERGEAATVVVALNRAHTALAAATTAELAARDSSRVLRRQRDSILAAVPVARPVRRRQVTLVQSPDTLMRRVVAERDTARLDVIALTADTATMHASIRALEKNALAQDGVDSTRASVVVPAIDTASTQIQTATAAVRPRWHVRTLRFIGRHARDVITHGIAFAAGSAR